MSEHDQTYGDDREAALRARLRALAELIQSLERRGELLARVPELLRLLGEARSELFHYEVRKTYDTPELADHRRLVEEARDAGWVPDDDGEDDEPWRRRREE